MPRHRPHPDQVSPDKNVVSPRQKRRSPQNEAKTSHGTRVASLRATGRDASARISARRERVAHRLSMAGPLRVLTACAALCVSFVLLAIIATNYGQYQEYDSQVDGKEGQLRALQSQHSDMKRSLAFLQLPKGREQVLLQNGYLRPGDRILLFPSESKPSSVADDPANASTPTSSPVLSVSPSTSANTAPETGNAWSRASDTLGRWWDDARRASGSHSASREAP